LIILLAAAGFACGPIEQHDTAESEVSAESVSVDDARLIAAGWYHGCARAQDGSIACWGRDSFGQATAPQGTDFVSVGAGAFHSCALREDGSVTCWGRDNRRQVTNTPSGPFVELAVGSYHNCARDAQGDVMCWGWNGSGQAGSSRSHDVVQLAPGRYHTCALDSSGRASCWGLNNYGQGSPNPAETYVQLSAGAFHACGVTAAGAVDCWGWNGYRLGDVPAGNDFVEVEAGDYHACARREDGSATCWGANSRGKATAPSNQAFTDLAAGYIISCGITDGGEAQCWGSSSFGANSPPADVAFGVAPEPSGPAALVDTLSMSSEHGCAIADDQSISCFRATRPDYFIPATPTDSGYVQVDMGLGTACALKASGEATCWGRYAYRMDLPNADYVQVSVGSRVCALRTNGAVDCPSGYSSPEGEVFESFSSYATSVCGLKANGEVLCWGERDDQPQAGLRFISVGLAYSGACGVTVDNTIECWGGSSGVTPPAGNDFVEVTANSLMCARRLDGTMTCWGSYTSAFEVELDGPVVDAEGTCGLTADGSIDCHDAWVVLEGAGYLDFASDSNVMCAVTSAGEIECLGHGEYGQLDAPAGAFVDVATTKTFSCGIDTDGAAICWGLRAPNLEGTFKQIDGYKDSLCALHTDGAITCVGRDLEGSVTAVAERVKVAAGSTHVCALSADGTVDCGGDRAYGASDAPEGTFTDIVAGRFFTCGLTAEGGVQCWGDDDIVDATPNTTGFTDLKSTDSEVCGLQGGDVTCWGGNITYLFGGTTVVGSGEFVAIERGWGSLCGVVEGGALQCMSTYPSYGSFEPVDGVSVAIP